MGCMEDMTQVLLGIVHAVQGQAASHLGVIFLDTKYLCKDLLAKMFVNQASTGQLGVEACSADPSSTSSSMQG